MRTVRSQLAIFEAEVGRLAENQACAEKEWKDKTSRLECQLTQVTTQKVAENGMCFQKLHYYFSWINCNLKVFGLYLVGRNGTQLIAA